MTKQEYDRNWYKKNKARIGAAKREARRRYLQRIRDYVVEAKNKPCADCRCCYPSYVMDFDHRENKKFTIANHKWRAFETVVEEIAKCDVVCANCHRIRTFAE